MRFVCSWTRTTSPSSSWETTCSFGVGLSVDTPWSSAAAVATLSSGRSHPARTAARSVLGEGAGAASRVERAAEEPDGDRDGDDREGEERERVVRPPLAPEHRSAQTVIGVAQRRRLAECLQPFWKRLHGEEGTADERHRVDGHAGGDLA